MIVKPGYKEEMTRAIWIYLRSIDEIPPLAESDEERLARAAAGGDRDAGRALVRAHLRLAARIALERGKPGHPPLGLIREGNRELLRAAENFHPDRGESFGRYAAARINRAILQAVNGTADK